MDGMMLTLDQAGAQYSQSPVTADKGAVMEPACSPSSGVAGHYCSLFKIVRTRTAPARAMTR
jgi:hypothetical protein